LVLVQKWQTKCAEKMDLYINDQVWLLHELALAEIKVSLTCLFIL